jgi:predicted DNA repair protein MutK
MAASSLLALIDDIAAILDDVAVLSKVAAKKTAGVLGDDLALNAQQVAGVQADRELPVVWGVFKGSFLNKLILVPAALLISAWAPWLITPLLVVGGLYLCFEGFEKVAHRWLHSPEEDAKHHRELVAALVKSEEELLAFEREKIKGAVRTDFILSGEIIAITLGIVAQEPLISQALVLSTISLAMTFGVYGLVAAIVKMDDLGLYLNRRPGESIFAAAMRRLGAGLIQVTPKLMRLLGILGTAAMFLVGGGILVHAWPALHHAVHAVAAPMAQQGGLAGFGAALLGPLVDGLTGLVAGGVVLAGVLLVGKVRGKKAAT